MREIAVMIKIMPNSLDVDLDELNSNIKNTIKVKDSKIEDIAFGLKSLKILVIVPDEKNGTSIIEEKIKKMHGVKSVEIESETLI